MKTKVCSTCHEPKPLEDFHVYRRNKDGRTSRCKICACAARRKTYWQDPDLSRQQALASQQRTLPRVLAYNREYGKKNPDRVRQWNENGRINNPKTYILNNARRRAKDRGVPFSLTKADIEVPEICPVLGIPLHLGKEHSQPYSPSIDSIIPELGYVPGNVAIMSHKANTIKSNATVEELEAVVAWLKKTLNPTPVPGI